MIKWGRLKRMSRERDGVNGNAKLIHEQTIIRITFDCPSGR